MGEVVPLAAGTGLVEQGVDDLPHLVGALVAAGGGMLRLPGLADQPRYACATHSSDNKGGITSHTTLSVTVATDGTG